MTPVSRIGLGLFALVVACSPRVGTQCDDDMARTVAYDSAGSPAYVGQSMLITSCAGGGSFCHADGARDRYGAPFGMNFDPVLADAARFPETDTGSLHLYAAQIASHRLRNDIFSQVASGAMPPGNVGANAAATPYRTYTSMTDLTGTAVPSLRSAEGREILRNWLACGSPVVEATAMTPTIACTSDTQCLGQHCDGTVCRAVGAVEPARQVTFPHWQSIYDTVLAPTCALALCHSAQSAEVSGSLDLSSPSIAYTALVSHAPTTASCGTRVVPSQPDMSFLVHKIEGTENTDTCGDPMPIGGMLTPDQVAAIRTWIMNGAMMD